MKKIIKLINSERTNPTITSKRAAVDCDSTSTDICYYIDNAMCTSNSFDKCNKDYASCYDQGYDYCTGYKDVDACGGSYDLN